MSPGTCIHFNGVQHDCCAAGVKYAEFGHPISLRMPCIKLSERRGFMPGDCWQRVEPTAEQILEDQREDDRMMKRLLAGIKVASEWRVKPRPIRPRAEIVECPVCKGKLHLTQSSVNGHVHGRCETEGCLQWME